MSLTEGVHDSVAPELYHSGDVTERAALSQSIAKIILARSPLHAWHAHPKLNPSYQPEHKDSFDFGTTVHTLLLEGEKFAGKVATVDASDWRIKVAKEHKEACRESGRIPLLMKDWQRVVEMVAAIRDQIAARDDEPALFDAGKPEQSIVWEDNGVLCKGRLDYLHDDFRTADDLKSIPSKGGTANPHDWGRRTFWGIGADIEARFHARGVRILTGIEPQFRFVVAEGYPPYAISVLDLAPSAIELADHKIDTALEIWKRCLDSGVWPGYPSGIASVEVGWQAQDFVERFWQDEELAA